MWSGIHCPQIKSLATTECFSREQISEWDFGHVQDDVNPRILRMLEGIVSFDAAQIKYKEELPLSCTWTFKSVQVSINEN